MMHAVIALMDEHFFFHFSPQDNITYERYVFQNVRQNVDENIHQFYIRVKEQVVECDSGMILDTEIKQQMILATNNNNNNNLISKLTYQDIKFEWSDDCEKSFQTLNNCLCYLM